MSTGTFQSRMKALSPKQRETLKSIYVRADDPPDLYDFVTSGTLAWHNRERVLDALKRRGLLDGDGAVTDTGVRLVEDIMANEAGSNPCSGNWGTGNDSACMRKSGHSGDCGPTP